MSKLMTCTNWRYTSHYAVLVLSLHCFRDVCCWVKVTNLSLQICHSTLHHLCNLTLDILYPAFLLLLSWQPQLHHLLQIPLQIMSRFNPVSDQNSQILIYCIHLNQRKVLRKLFKNRLNQRLSFKLATIQFSMSNRIVEMHIESPDSGLEPSHLQGIGTHYMA